MVLAVSRGKSAPMTRNLAKSSLILTIVSLQMQMHTVRHRKHWTLQNAQLLYFDELFVEDVFSTP
jgi:predicted ATPase